MIWSFIDYENIGTLESVDLSIYQKIFIFCGPRNPNIKLGDQVINEFIDLKIIKLNTSGPNNLDFHLAYYLGQLSQNTPLDIEFHIITKDNGFNGLIEHIKHFGRKCQRITFQSKTNTENLPTIQLSDNAEKVRQKLTEIRERNRPTKKTALINWITNQCRAIATNINAKKIIDELEKSNKIKIENDKITYQLKS
ncbi:Uncharacterised protein [Phocoenobacter uteri]|uniref:PIN-like domain-containing protein n=1 Tax=Phocoenobacter uteri TaxID=146806 RepID=A0A379C890_9PAST|nr:PIN domain-containing protein [Phocoenobacter uteri]MDG6882225.1 hypothetical protein [Phocoenobacter uteri]SUB58379.1 Uncharacterised protein [Phocoenobacter uteri]